MACRLPIFLVLTVLAFPALAEWDRSVLVGHWESYQHDFTPTYQRLEINPDFSGEFTYALGKQPPARASFLKDSFAFFDGFAVLTVDRNLKIVLSALSLSDSKENKRLLGQSFMYVSEGEKLSLINAQPVRFLPAERGGIRKFLEHAQQRNDQQSP